MGSQHRRPVCSAQLREVLLARFQTATALPMPGGDALTLDDAVDCYRLGMAAGLLPCWEELCKEYPDLAEEIRAVFLG